MSHMFSQVVAVPPDAIFDISTRYKADAAELKLNLGVGAYRTDEGDPLVLNVVKKAEAILLEKHAGGQLNKEYLPIDGYADFREGTLKLILGSESPSINEGRVACCQSLSGTGALRIGGVFVANNLGADRTVYLPNPTWANHHAIFKNSGLQVETYRYFKPETKGLDFEGMCEDLAQVAPGSIVLLHACAHNPTGVDPTQEQWQALAAIVKERQAIPFFDCAYQGYASGDLDQGRQMILDRNRESERYFAFFATTRLLWHCIVYVQDAYAVRYFESQGIEMMIAQSYSKNFGLYGERIGAISVTTNGGPEVASAIQSQLKLIVRPMYSNPPSQGAKIVAEVMASDDLYAEWVAELKVMSGRIIQMRAALRAAIEATGVEGDFSYITKQIGMFAYTGLSKDQVARLESEFHIYMVASGRISMAGVSSKNVEYLGQSIATVLGA